MAEKRNHKTAAQKKKLDTRLRQGDPVMVLVGGNAKKNRELKGQTGKILRFIPKRDRVVVEGLNIIKRHKRASMMNEASGILEKEGSVHISNVMYYNEELKRPVRLKVKRLEDGRKVRGFINPETKKFEQLDA
ncbi:MAG: 50S ribosomal protein L24 [Bdellovibrionales bacterium]|nr:50S ribosomal protein L24 [Bdellovibrionales bacterium]